MAFWQQRPLTEWTSFITTDGEEFIFNIPSSQGRWVLGQSGWGTPPIDYITQRSPLQDGRTVKDFFLQPRVIQLVIRQEFCDRPAWWVGRADILDHIRPNRQVIPGAVVPGTLRRYLPAGERRDLSVYILEGPRFEPQRPGIWDEYAFVEVLRFIAYDPVVFDPTAATSAFALALGTQLVFSTPFS